ncbi:MAG TPA: DNA methyltransferase [Chloroflexia bacterium]|jgi:DNA modification methylase
MTAEVEDAQQELIEAARPFEEWYDSLQQQFPRSCIPPTDATNDLVTAQANSLVSIHRWYSLKEAFDAELPTWLCHWMTEHYAHVPTVVCDPFLGGGTTGVSLAQQGISVTGVEYNPFIAFVSATKAAITQVSPAEFEQAVIRMETAQLPTTPLPVPELVTLSTPEYSDPADVQVLLAAHQLTCELEGSPAIRDMLRLGIAAAVEDVFNLRKDGRALRHVPKPGPKAVPLLLSLRWRQILADVRDYHEHHGRDNGGTPAAQAEGGAKGTAPQSVAPTATPPVPVRADKPLFDVYRGTATNLKEVRTVEGAEACIRNECFDTIMYSPPYLNNFDYSEIYKLELWLLHFVQSHDAWRNLRLGTLRSHHSLAFPQTTHLADDPRTRAIAEQLTAMGESRCIRDDERWRLKQEIAGYFDDMYLALKEQWRVLKPGGVLTYVVANSRHYYLPIATDVVIAEIARCLGFELLDLVVLRKRNGRTRQKLFLRESAVFLRKPHSQGTVT